MGFKMGIVGLPNVGKSTLYNALSNCSIPAVPPGPLTGADAERMDTSTVAEIIVTSSCSSLAPSSLQSGMNAGGSCIGLVGSLGESIFRVSGVSGQVLAITDGSAAAAGGSSFTVGPDPELATSSVSRGS